MSASLSKTNFLNVSYLWDDLEAQKFDQDPVGQLIYRSNLLGADLRLTNYGGGNTSVKLNLPDPLTGQLTPVMYVKGSGGDLGTLKRSGLAGLYLERLNALKEIYKGLDFEDEMVELFQHCIFDLNSKAPSIDTPLHAFLPFAHIDHLHPDALIAIAAAKNGEETIQSLFNGEIGWIGWQRPGFDLGLKLAAMVSEKPTLKGIVLGGHGLFTWGDNSYDCYLNTLNVIEKCANYLIENERSAPFGGQIIASSSIEKRQEISSLLLPVLRGLCGQQASMVGHFSDAENVLTFVNSKDLTRLAPLGTSCPDHFLRTKIAPLVLPLTLEEDFTNAEEIKAKLLPAFEAYRKDYTEYYEACKHPDSPAIRDTNPVILLLPGVGLFSFAKDKPTARIAAEYYTNAIAVMRGAEAISSYVALPRQEAFNIEYWLLEEAKLQRMPKPKPLSGKVALITGAANGIGKAVAKTFLAQGACVTIADLDLIRLEETKQELIAAYGADFVESQPMDLSKTEQITTVVNATVLRFGGIDILVNSAGFSISKSLQDHTLADWHNLVNVMQIGLFDISQKVTNVMEAQEKGGDILNIVSKNAVVAGPNNVAYGTVKAAQLHMSRLLAAELGPKKIRVNVVNPDAVISGSKIWEGDWAEGRAKAYNISVAELPAFYAKRTLLNEIILPEDIANACFAFVSGLLNKSTGNALNVDGGLAAAFLR